MYTRVNTHGQAPLPQPVEGGPASGPGPHKAFRLFLLSGPREAQGGGPPAKPSSEGANPPASGVRWGRGRLREGARGGAGQHRGAHGSESWCARSGRGRLQPFQKPGGGRISNETPAPPAAKVPKTPAFRPAPLRSPARSAEQRFQGDVPPSHHNSWVWRPPGHEEAPRYKEASLAFPGEVSGSLGPRGGLPQTPHCPEFTRGHHAEQGCSASRVPPVPLRGL